MYIERGSLVSSHLTCGRASAPVNIVIRVTSSLEDTEVPDITVRGVPDHLHQELKSAASRNHRSLNGEILSRLMQSSVSPRRRDTKDLLDRIRKLRESIGPIDISEEDLREMRNKGRP